MALALKARGLERSVFVVTGDGELHEGSNWEALMFAAHHGLDNLHLIVDDNKICMLGHTETVLSHQRLAARLGAFGWETEEVDGHDVLAVQAALVAMKRRVGGNPKALIARTVKGRGVPGLEDAPLSHILSPKPEVIDRLLGRP